jgi:AcrR family transcriptional regulator
MNPQPPQRRTQPQRRAESERKLLEATAQIIVEHGFAGLSLTAIGRRAGCSHALVNHLFGSKAALIDRLNDTVDALYRSRIQLGPEEDDGADALVTLAANYLRLVTSEDPMARVHVILWAQAVAGTAELRESRTAWDRHFRRGVAEVFARSTGTTSADPRAQATALVVVGVLRGVAMQQLLDPTAVSLPDAIARVNDTVRGMLVSSP